MHFKCITCVSPHCCTAGTVTHICKINRKWDLLKSLSSLHLSNSEIVIQVKAEWKVLQNGTQLLLCIHTHFLFILCTMVTVLSGTDLIICVSIFGYEQYI